jgi:hypothetical protein
MMSRDRIDLLRTILVNRKHILPKRRSEGQDCILLNHGEFLLSLMSHDDSLSGYLQSQEGISDPGLSLYNDLEHKDFDLWVDVIKFVWLGNGVTAALDLIKGHGYFAYTFRLKQSVRERYVDELALIVHRKLRESGTKYRELATFFADASSERLLAKSDEADENFDGIES